MSKVEKKYIINLNREECEHLRSMYNSGVLDLNKIFKKRMVGFETPCIVYIYERQFINRCRHCEYCSFENVCNGGRCEYVCSYGEKPVITSKRKRCFQNKYSGGKVIGEFVCTNVEKIETITKKHGEHSTYNMINLYTQIKDYSVMPILTKNGTKGCFISAEKLRFYDKPMKLSDFYQKCDLNCDCCEYLVYTHVSADEMDSDCACCGRIPIKSLGSVWCETIGPCV